jgi:hypothetical protein
MKSTAAVLAMFSSVAAGFDWYTGTCPNVTLLHSVKGEGWYDMCQGLDFVPNISDAAGCKAQCHGNNFCSVWQLIDDAGVKCWNGDIVTKCYARQDPQTNEKFKGDLKDGERIQHGFIKATPNSKMETLGLMFLPETTGDDAVKAERCKHACYTDVTCTVWQYGSNGCWMEHLPGNTKGNTTTTSDWALAMTAGETVEHVCPPYQPPPCDFWCKYKTWIIVGSILALLAIAGLIFFLLQKKPKVKKTRTIIPKKEEPKPVITFIPQPTVLIPQTSVVQMAAPQVQYAAPQYGMTAPLMR